MPLVGTCQHGHFGRAVRQRGRHDAGQVVFAFERVARQVFGQKRRKPRLRAGDKIRREAPQVHRDDRRFGQRDPAFAAVLGIGDAAVPLFDAGALGHADQAAALVQLAHPAGHGAVLADRVAQQKAHHRPRRGRAGRGGGTGKVLVDQAEAGRAIVVVGVDDRKRRVDGFGRRQDRVRGAPRLDAPFGHGKARGQLVQRLVGVAHGQPGGFGARAHAFAERLVDLRLDDEHDRLEPGAARVKKAVIQDGLAVRAHRVDLLEPAVAAAHPGGHHDQNRFAVLLHRLKLPSGRLRRSVRSRLALCCLYLTRFARRWQAPRRAGRVKQKILQVVQKMTAPQRPVFTKMAGRRPGGLPLCENRAIIEL